MAKKMLIDATHAEETRVVVVDGNKVEEFDFESENKRQLAGNIYLAKVTRVEPSLQAAFVDYGGNRHGFLAFSEIHPDYYQIPVADREALLAEEMAYAKAQEEEEERPKRSRRRRSRSKSKAESVKADDAVETKEVSEETNEGSAEAQSPAVSGMDVIEPEGTEADAMIADAAVEEGTSPAFTVHETPVEEPTDEPEAVEEAAPVAEDAPVEETAAKPEETTEEAPAAEAAAESSDAEEEASEEDTSAEETSEDDTSEDDDSSDDDASDDDSDDDDSDDDIESVADDDTEEEIRPKRKPRPRKYKIQEVIKVRQVMLVQVVKEERGNKGAALTTYLSLAGRYCVLMPNTARGGGISRKITNAADRKKLKEIAGELDVPQGAGLIVRTAGAQRTKTEIKRDYDYLKRMWEQIRELTLKSSAPAKIYEEGDLIKRSIRDLYNKDIDEVFVEGEVGYREAKDFMRMIMPSHAKNVKHYHDQLPLFARYQVESYLSSMFNPTVQLKSGGYIVIDVTEALVAVDVNSGRATKEGSIEETALKTNLEAAEEVARQARLRDLAGLIVIDFIDMEERRNNTAVEKRLKDKLKTDRARIQVGRISGFGLLEMSRQRLRPGMLEATTQPCPHCHGTGLIRSDDNMALSILRQLEEEGTRKRSREVLLKAPVAVVNYLMNMKREKIAMIEARYGMAIRIEADPMLISPDYSIERFKTATRVVPEVTAPVVSASADLMADYEEDEEDQVEEAVAEEETPEATDEDQKPKKRRRRRRRRKKSDQTEGQDGSENGSDSEENGSEDEPSEGEAQAAEGDETPKSEEAPAAEEAPAEKPKRTRSRRKKAEAPAEATDEAATETSEAEAAPEATEEKPKRTRTRRKKTEDAPAAEGEEAPKPKRKRRTKAEIEADKAAKAAAEAEKAAAEAAEQPAEQPAEEPAPAAEAPAPEVVAEAASEEAPEAAPEAPAEEVAAEAAPAPAPEETPAVEPVAEAPAEPAPEVVQETMIAAEPVAEVATAEVAEAEPADDKPKRRGWWSR
ncbi:Rne/Rng family ribonuclease [Celeribacter litoreus]|uniref:Rne/Rng family ribonuclease n=1 Tax=Celeribacter litoreus TaxID=2876714 RepID=UPI001CC9FFFC|nr:ribonuclease E/G [Celeribacter litoreus]MCA0044753.1 Rne/Rng family ribonuclease [Celeribacter litoreus]